MELPLWILPYRKDLLVVSPEGVIRTEWYRSTLRMQHGFPKIVGKTNHQSLHVSHIYRRKFIRRPFGFTSERQNSKYKIYEYCYFVNISKSLSPLMGLNPEPLNSRFTNRTERFPSSFNTTEHVFARLHNKSDFTSTILLFKDAIFTFRDQEMKRV